MLKVVCVWKTPMPEPPQIGRDRVVPLTRDYPYILRDATEKFIKTPHRFLCLTDDLEVLVEPWAIPLVHGWRGWWSKMEIFRLEPPVLYIDLDTVIIKDISWLADKVCDTPSELFTMIKDPGKGRGSLHPPIRAKGQSPAWGIIGWNSDLSWVYERFLPQAQGAIDTLRGEDDWLDTQPELCPTYVMKHLYSYKHDLDWGRKSPPEDCHVVVFHAEPRPHEVRHDWMPKIWRVR